MSHSPDPTATSAPIFGTGEMADRIRAFDWDATSVGPIASWPDTLLITVNTLLASRHPMFLMWGADLLQFYNDAYRPSLGNEKHPSALGQQARLFWPEAWPIIGPEFDAVMSNGQSTWREDTLVPIHRNGQLEDVYWTYSCSPVRDPAGVIRGALVVCSETTLSVLARRQLQQERERLASIFEQAPVFFAVLDGPHFIFERVNRRYQELIGSRNLLGRAVREAVPEAESQGFIDLLGKVYRTGVPFLGRNTPIQLARNPGEPLETRFLDFVYQPRREPDGTITGIIALGIDVTESKQAEQALLQSEKLAAVGRLASSIAHEINNPLEAVTNLIYLAQHTATNPTTREYLSLADVELRRVSAIVNQTLRFYRQTTSPRAITFAELLDIALPLHQSRIANASISVERCDRIHPPITCWDGEIRQVLSNLLGNAIDAMASTGGRLLLRSRPATHPRTGRPGAILTLADTGPGIPARIRARIFEPFFTTKGIGGTGLGLWISQEIVGRHHGRLTVRSSQAYGHSGTVFQLFLSSDPPDIPIPTA